MKAFQDVKCKIPLSLILAFAILLSVCIPVSAEGEPAAPAESYIDSGAIDVIDISNDTLLSQGSAERNGWAYTAGDNTLVLYNNTTYSIKGEDRRASQNFQIKVMADHATIHIVDSFFIKNEKRPAIDAENSLTIRVEKNVAARINAAAGNNAGAFNVNKDLTYEGPGKFVVEASSGTGINAGNLKITAGTLDAYGGPGNTGGRGISADSVNVSGGILRATGGGTGNGTESGGTGIYTKSLNVSGGEVYASGGDGKKYGGTGIDTDSFVLNSISVNSDTIVVAKSGSGESKLDALKVNKSPMEIQSGKLNVMGNVSGEIKATERWAEVSITGDVDGNILAEGGAQVTVTGSVKGNASAEGGASIDVGGQVSGETNGNVKVGETVTSLQELQKALDNAKDGGSVTLSGDVDFGNSALYLKAGKTVNVVGAKNVVLYGAKIYDAGKIRFSENVRFEGKKDTFTGNGADGVYIGNNAEVEIEGSVTGIGPGHGINIKNAKVTVKGSVKGGTNQKGSAGSGIRASGKDTVVTASGAVSGGAVSLDSAEYTGGLSNLSGGHGLLAEENCTVTLRGLVTGGASNADNSIGGHGVYNNGAKILVEAGVRGGNATGKESTGGFGLYAKSGETTIRGDAVGGNSTRGNAGDGVYASASAVIDGSVRGGIAENSSSYHGGNGVTVKASGDVLVDIGGNAVGGRDNGCGAVSRGGSIMIRGNAEGGTGDRGQNPLNGTGALAIGEGADAKVSVKGIIRGGPGGYAAAAYHDGSHKAVIEYGGEVDGVADNDFLMTAPSGYTLGEYIPFASAEISSITIGVSDPPVLGQQVSRTALNTAGETRYKIQSPEWGDGTLSSYKIMENSAKWESGQSPVVRFTVAANGNAGFSEKVRVSGSAWQSEALERLSAKEVRITLRFKDIAEDSSKREDKESPDKEAPGFDADSSNEIGRITIGVSGPPAVGEPADRTELTTEPDENYIITDVQWGEGADFAEVYANTWAVGQTPKARVTIQTAVGYVLVDDLRKSDIKFSGEKKGVSVQDVERLSSYEAVATVKFPGFASPEGTVGTLEELQAAIDASKGAVTIPIAPGARISVRGENGGSLKIEGKNVTLMCSDAAQVINTTVEGAGRIVFGDGVELLGDGWHGIAAKNSANVSVLTDISGSAGYNGVEADSGAYIAVRGSASGGDYGIHAEGASVLLNGSAAGGSGGVHAGIGAVVVVDGSALGGGSESGDGSPGVKALQNSMVQIGQNAQGGDGLTRGGDGVASDGARVSVGGMAAGGATLGYSGMGGDGVRAENGSVVTVKDAVGGSGRAATGGNGILADASAVTVIGDALGGSGNAKRLFGGNGVYADRATVTAHGKISGGMNGYGVYAGQQTVVSASQDSPDGGLGQFAPVSDERFSEFQPKNSLVSNVTISSLGKDAAITKNGGTLQLAALVQPDGSSPAVIWSVDNEDGAAIINQKGLLTAVANGRITVRADASDGSGSFGILPVMISGQTPLPDADTVMEKLLSFFSSYEPKSGDTPDRIKSQVLEVLSKLVSGKSGVYTVQWAGEVKFIVPTTKTGGTIEGTLSITPPSSSNIDIPVNISLPRYKAAGGGGAVTGKESTSRKEQYFILTPEAGTGGRISPDGGVLVKSGRSKTFLIYPDEGYAIDMVWVDGKPVKVENNRYSFRNVRKNHTIRATFYLDAASGEWLKPNPGAEA